MDIQKVLARLNELIAKIEKEAIQPFPSHITLTESANQMGYLVNLLKKELL